MYIYHESRECVGEAGTFQPTMELWKKKKKQMLVPAAKARAFCGHRLLPALRFFRVALLGTTPRTTGPGHTGQDLVS